MKRVAPVATIALVLVAGGLWLSRRSYAESEAAVVMAQATAEELPPIPDGYALVEPLTTEPVRSFEAAEEVLEPGHDYGAILETNKGTLVIDLYEDEAPATVNNFVFLALHRYYDGVVFHRVLEDFMAQTGDPTGTGTGGPGYQFDNEIAEELSHDRRGVVAMANAGPNTNGSQFFITFAATPWLDGSYNIFGAVTEGEEVLDELQRIDPQTPSAIASLDAPLSDLAAQGIELSGDPSETAGAYLEANLGALPAEGQTFALDGYTGVVGRAGGEPAVGFWPQPDLMERVFVIRRPNH